MKNNIYLITFLMVVFSFVQVSTAQTDNNNASHLQNLFTQKDAERILGEAAHLKDSATTVKDNVSAYNCAYIADAIDTKTGKTGIIYFMVEHYNKIDDAKQVYTSIYKANRGSGVKKLKDIGDETYLQSHKKNLLFILARKGGKLLRMKANKVTSHTSSDEFKKVTKEIVDRF